MAAIGITRNDFAAKELRGASAKARDARAARPMLAIALVLEGNDRKASAENCGIDRQTLRDWVHCCNAGGLAGLEGPPSRLTTEQKANTLIAPCCTELNSIDPSMICALSQSTARETGGCWHTSPCRGDRFLVRRLLGQ